MATKTKSKKQPVGHSFHIGMNVLDKKHYAGWDGALRAPEADAKSMLKVAEKSGFTNSTILLSKEATRQTVLDAFAQLAKSAQPGDLVFISYSGHGGQVKDMNDDEADFKDETWCLYDGQLIDDEIYWCLSKFKPEVRIIGIIDCCHSGTAFKAIQEKKVRDRYPRRKKKVVPQEILFKTYEKNIATYKKIGKQPKLKNARAKINASIIQFSACQDSEVAYDGSKNSLFTEYLLKTWKRGKYTGNHKAFHADINDLIPMGRPNYLPLGKNNTSFTRSRPFVI